MHTAIETLKAIPECDHLSTLVKVAWVHQTLLYHEQKPKVRIELFRKQQEEWEIFAAGVSLIMEKANDSRRTVTEATIKLLQQIVCSCKLNLDPDFTDLHEICD